MKALILLTLLTLATCEKHHKHVDPFQALLDQHIGQAFAYQNLWPWTQLMKAAALLDEDSFSEPQILSKPDKMEVRMNVKRFKPEDLRIRVKQRNIIVEGKQNMDNDHRFMANHFVQRFVLPAGSKQEEVSAVLKEGILTISVPRHEVPPPPPEREVPIEVIQPPTTEKPMEIPEKKTDKPPKKASEITPKVTEPPTKASEISTEKQSEVDKKVQPLVTSPATPLEQLDLVEATTHVGKIRKKELKEPKVAKDNEVSKGLENNGLDYALIDAE
ncbi:hsp20/alpha crystallin family domain-containing protein [Phthorimaea operculella]|nr:hsp20/alpha crystallin family domain-containing protein [Phthorimaea operculella]